MGVAVRAILSFLIFLYLLGVFGAYRQGKLKGVSDLVLSFEVWGIILASTFGFSLFVVVLSLLTLVIFRRRTPSAKDAKKVDTSVFPTEN